jgi:saccharopine dehydrogenase (NADP+, L-glutamate forming)
MQKLQWLGLFSKKRIRTPNASPALILEHLLREKWALHAGDQDKIILYHEVDYQLKGKKRTRTSTMVLTGIAPLDTAMAKNVSLPIGILLKQLLDGKLPDTTGKSLQAPAVYEPILQELEAYGIVFEQMDIAL